MILSSLRVGMGFVGGHRFVAADWASSPISAFSDVMWAKPSGDPALLVSERAAAFVTSVYPFDDVRCCALGGEPLVSA